jgi:hypothetical protein
MNKYVLYNVKDDSVVCGNDWKTMLFDSYELAEAQWIGYPEEVTHFSQLPKHIQEIILNEQYGN